MDIDTFLKNNRPRRPLLLTFGVLLGIFATAAAAFGVYALLLTQVFAPAGLIPEDVDRVIRRADLLRTLAREGTRPVLLFGSSVVLEGADAAVVEAQLGNDVPVYNVAESNAGIRNLMVNLPLISAADPRYLVCCLRRSQLTADGMPELPNELLLGYAYAEYLDAGRREPQWIYELLSERERDSLPENALSKLLACRVLPLRAVEQEIRHSVRSDLRVEGFASNFRNPWRYTRQIPPDRLKMLVERSRENFAGLHFDGHSPVAETLRACLRYCRERDVPFLLVLTPENPLIQEAIPREVQEPFDAEVRAFCQASGADFLVLGAELFTPNDFLDHSHLNASGREIFSRALGAALAERMLIRYQSRISNRKSELADFETRN